MTNDFFTVHSHDYRVDSDDYGVDVNEATLIDQYFLEYDPEPIAKRLKSNDEITPEMRCFIADVLTGKIKPNQGQRKTPYQRNLAIYKEAEKLKKKYPKKPLRGNRNEDGIADILAEKYGMKEEAVIQAIKQVKMKRDTEGSLVFTDDDGHIRGVESAPPKDFADILACVDDVTCEFLMKNQPTTITMGETKFHIENNTATVISPKRR